LKVEKVSELLISSIVC